MNVPQRTGPPGAPQDLLARMLTMLLFAVVFWILGWTLAVTAIVQIVVRVLNGRPQAELARFGASLAAYAHQVIEYLTFASETVPWPFADWPAAPDERR